MAYVRWFRNGIMSAPRPPPPARGCYVRQLIHKQEKGTCLPWYLAPPSQDLPFPVCRGLGAGVVFGLVYDVEEFGSLLSVMVPVKTVACFLSDAERCDLPELVWINVYTNRHRGREVSHHYCQVVPEYEVRSWHAQGWKDVVVQL